MRRFLLKSVTHLSHLSYLEGAAKSHELLTRLVNLLRFLERRGQWVPIGEELRALQLLVVTLNSVEDGLRSVQLKLPAGAGGSMVPRGSMVEPVLGWMYGEDAAPVSGSLTLTVGYDEQEELHRIEFPEYDAFVDVPTELRER